MTSPKALLLVAASSLVALICSPYGAAGDADCHPSPCDCVQAPPVRIVVDQSPPEVIFKPAPACTVNAPAPCPQPAAEASCRCGLFQRFCHRPAQPICVPAPQAAPVYMPAAQPAAVIAAPVTMQAFQAAPVTVAPMAMQLVQPAPMVAAPVTMQAVQPTPVVAAPVAMQAVQPAPVVAAPTVALQAMQPAPVVMAPVQTVAAPPPLQVMPAPVYAAPPPCGPPQRFTQESDLTTAANLLQRVKEILSAQPAPQTACPSALTDSEVATQVRGLRGRVDKLEQLIRHHDDWIEKQQGRK